MTTGYLRFCGDADERNVIFNALPYDGEWPPPERMSVIGQEFVRAKFSRLTDEGVAENPHVVRGATYVLPCHSYGQDGSRCALPAGHAPAGDGRVHELVQEVTR